MLDISLKVEAYNAPADMLLISDEFPGVYQLLAGTQTDQKQALFVGESYFRPSIL
jgi:hypothetical protein